MHFHSWYCLMHYFDFIPYLKPHPFHPLHSIFFMRSVVSSKKSPWTLILVPFRFPWRESSPSNPHPSFWVSGCFAARALPSNWALNLVFLSWGTSCDLWWRICSRRALWLDFARRTRFLPGSANLTGSSLHIDRRCGWGYWARPPWLASWHRWDWSPCGTCRG